MTSIENLKKRVKLQKRRQNCSNIEEFTSNFALEDIPPLQTCHSKYWIANENISQSLATVTMA